MAISTEPEKFTSQFETIIKDGLEKALESEFEIIKSELLKRLEDRKREIISSIGLKLMRTINMMDSREGIIITIKELPKA